MALRSSNIKCAPDRVDRFLVVAVVARLVDDGTKEQVPAAFALDDHVCPSLV